MKKLIAFSILLVSIAMVHAQDAAKAKNLLDEVSAKVKSYDNIN